MKHSPFAIRKLEIAIGVEQRGPWAVSQRGLNRELTSSEIKNIRLKRSCSNSNLHLTSGIVLKAYLPRMALNTNLGGPTNKAPGIEDAS